MSTDTDDDVACVLAFRHMVVYVPPTWHTHGALACTSLVVKHPLKA